MVEKLVDSIANDIKSSALQQAKGWHFSDQARVPDHHFCNTAAAELAQTQTLCQSVWDSKPGPSNLFPKNLLLDNGKLLKEDKSDR